MSLMPLVSFSDNNAKKSLWAPVYYVAFTLIVLYLVGMVLSNIGLNSGSISGVMILASPLILIWGFLQGMVGVVRRQKWSFIGTVINLLLLAFVIIGAFAFSGGGWGPG